MMILCEQPKNIYALQKEIQGHETLHCMEFFGAHKDSGTLYQPINLRGIRFCCFACSGNRLPRKVVPAARLRPRQSPRSETVPQCIDHLNRLAKFRDIKFSAGQIEQLNQIKKFFKFDFLMAATNFNANVTFRGASCLILVHEETWFR